LVSLNSTADKFATNVRQTGQLHPTTLPLNGFTKIAKRVFGSCKSSNLAV